MERRIENGVTMRELVSSFDWSTTPLGPMESWPQSLRTVVGILLSSRYAMWMAWGPELTFLYNDTYGQVTLGKKHPWALGRPAKQVWKEIWAEIGPESKKSWIQVSLPGTKASSFSWSAAAIPKRHITPFLTVLLRMTTGRYLECCVS